jgi:hypothetical protein
MHVSDGLVYSHEKAFFGKSVDHHSAFIFSGVSSVCGGQSQVRGGVQCINWGLKEIHEFLHFHNALFSKVVDGFSFILNELRDLVAE